MRLLILLLLCNYGVFAQTLLKYDNIESYDWYGGWSTGYGNNSGYYANASVSGTSSAAVIGSGNGTSVIEDGVYVLPNVNGLSSALQYELRFRLGSYKFGGQTAATAGVDVADYVLVYVSYNNSTLIQEIKINGYNNTLYNYNSTQLYKVASGTLTTYSAQNGNYSDVRLSFSGTTQFTSRIYARVNSLGEEWWFDNFELWQMTIPLPVELISFDGYKSNDKNVLRWSTASESNNDYFMLERSQDGNIWDHVSNIDAVGNSIEVNKYVYFDDRFSGYYRLTQYDIDGKSVNLGTIALIDDKTKYIVKIYDLSGREVGFDYHGIVMVVYSDGSIVKNFW
jgi:hypothetical protein